MSKIISVNKSSVKESNDINKNKESNFNSNSQIKKSDQSKPLKDNLNKKIT